MNGTQIDLNSILKGSNPLVYALVNFPLFFMVPWSRGEAEVCNTSYTGSNPVGTSNNGAVAEWHEGDELQPHTHWFDPSPCLKNADIAQ